jgi:tetratricopeptide (TPR) repeat protein
MNEQRQEAYLVLIQQLLSCPRGEEPEILAANQDLKSPDLVQVMLEMASNLRWQGELNQANRLMNIAGHLLGVYGNLSLAAIPQEYLDFLRKVLQATVDSSGDARVVDPVLAANTDKLDLTFAELLRHWVRENLAEVEADTAQFFAADIGAFSSLMLQFPLGNKANNLEIAISGYEIALTVFTREAFPEQWATAQNNLALAYVDRIRGKQAENLERAISFCENALQVYTREAFPVKWAWTQHNLGLIYNNRIQGEKAENLERAIAYFKAALQVRTEYILPRDWADTQNNLGISYLTRIRGNKAENLELAIASFQEVFRIYTEDDCPQDWATVQLNLGIAYGNRIQEEKAENLELAIASFHKALKVYTEDKHSCKINYTYLLLNVIIS